MQLVCATSLHSLFATSQDIAAGLDPKERDMCWHPVVYIMPIDVLKPSTRMTRHLTLPNSSFRAFSMLSPVSKDFRAVLNTGIYSTILSRPILV